MACERNRLRLRIRLPFLVRRLGPLTLLVGGLSRGVTTVASARVQEDVTIDPSSSARRDSSRYHDSTTTAAKAAFSWEDLDRRPNPRWYDEAKFGIFVHWGVFSVPSYDSEWFWYHWKENISPNDYESFVNATERPGFTYPEYASRFTAELYRPEYWAESFARSGAQYVVLTSKHHEGFSNWNSRDVPTTWNWNVMDIGPKRDVLGDLAVQVRKQVSAQTNQTMKFGIYHSLYEWFNPLYLLDKANNFTTQHFVNTKILPELYDLVEKYAPEIIWSDGDWEATSEYWKALEFLHWYATNSSVATSGVWNDRWGREILCQHGSFLTCADRYNPGTLQTRKWENALTIDKNSWGWNRMATIHDYMTVKELVDMLIQTVAFNGNMLLNVGPGADGTLAPIFVDRLLGLGEWLQVNGEAIYATRPWDVAQNESQSHVFYTKKDKTLYAILTAWPSQNWLQLTNPETTSETRAQFVGLELKKTTTTISPQLRDLPWTMGSTLLRNGANNVAATSSTRRSNEEVISKGMMVQLPFLTPNTIPCQHAWVIRITGLANVD